MLYLYLGRRPVEALVNIDRLHVQRLSVSGRASRGAIPMACERSRALASHEGFALPLGRAQSHRAVQLSLDIWFLVPVRKVMRMKKWMMKVCVAALFLGSATLALATNEVRVTVDPLSWHWEGSVTFTTAETILKGQGEVTFPFSVGPGGGVQQVATAQVGFMGEVVEFWLDPSTVTNPRSGDRYEVPAHSAEIKNRLIGPMKLTPNKPSYSPLTVFIEMFDKGSFYELRFRLFSGDQLVFIESDRCTTEGEEVSSACFECVLNGTILECKNRTAPDSNFSWIRRGIDYCVGNSNGQMVHGLDAPDSCDNFLLENDTLHAQCRDSGGQNQSTSIVLGEYFAAEPRSIYAPSIYCL